MEYTKRQRIEDLFENALDQESEQRSIWLSAQCADSPEILVEVQALLAAHQLAVKIFDESAFAASGQPRRVGPYEIIRELGRGGMGVVYLAERADGQFQRRVAIKLIRSSDEDEPIYQRFLAERQILAGFDHPNIARLLDGGLTEEGRRPYLVLEYVEGLPITTYCDRHRLGIDERLRLFLDVCTAVQHAHKNLIIHRDLKPSNILVTPAGQVKLLDFGIAKLINPTLSVVSVPVTRTQFRLMTPEYASPEQVRGETLTTSSDTYALGVLLYELLSGHPPYRLTTRSPMEVLQVVCEQDPERPSVRVTRTEKLTRGDGNTETVTPDSISVVRDSSPERLRRRLRGDLDSIVLMALRKEPSRRYPSADMLRSDVERYLDGLPVSAHRGSRRYRAAKFFQRHRIKTVAALVVALSLMLGLGTAIRQFRIANVERERTEQALRQSEEVTNFLMGLFEANDPAQALGDAITARDLLRRGVARADELDGQPLVQARMLDVMGQVYGSLGRNKEAQPLLERALSLRRQALGNEDSLIAQSLQHLAEQMRETGDYDAAERHYRESLAMRRRLLGTDHPDVARSMVDLAYQLHLSGDPRAAERLYRDALAMLRRQYGPEHLDVASAMSNLGLLLRQEEKFAEAEPLLRDALAIRRRLLGNDHPDVAVSAGLLAVLLRQTRDYDAAEALFQESLDISRRALGAEHPEVAHTMNGLAALLRDRGQLEAADSVSRRALLLRRKVLGPAHPTVASSLYMLAVIRARRGDVPGADSLLHQALVIRRRLHGETHPEVQRIRQELARCCSVR